MSALDGNVGGAGTFLDTSLGHDYRGWYVSLYLDGQTTRRGLEVYFEEEYFTLDPGFGSSGSRSRFKTARGGSLEGSALDISTTAAAAASPLPPFGPPRAARRPAGAVGGEAGGFVLPVARALPPDHRGQLARAGDQTAGAVERMLLRLR